MSNLSLVSLPVEILHRIFDHLDVYTIIGSVRCVSTQLHAIVNSYDRFQLKFDSTRKSYLKVISRLVKPSNIISLVLSGDYTYQGYIELFLVNFNISQFTRMRSLILDKVNNIEMDQILQHVTTNSLVSLTVDIRERKNNTIFSVIFSVVVHQTNLQKLYLNNLDYTVIEIPWPNQSKLEQLTIRDCTYHGYRIILCNLHCLRTLVIKNCTMDSTDQIVSSHSVTTSNSAKRQRTFIDSTGTVS
jgi:hypothetical protein